MELTSSYILAVAEQLSFVSAFLGGVSATILVTIVVFTSPKKSVNWIVGSSALAASSLLIAVIASWRLSILLHPDLPTSVEQSIIMVLWSGMIIGYIMGFIGLLTSIGLSGWLRSKQTGIITSSISVVAVLFFVLATPFGIS